MWGQTSLMQHRADPAVRRVRWGSESSGDKGRKQWRQRQKSLSVFQLYLSHPQLLCCSGSSDTLLFASNKYSLLSENDQQWP